MDTTPRRTRPVLPMPRGGPRGFLHRGFLRRGFLRRGFGAAGAAVAVAFVGTAALGAGQARAAGVAGGLAPVTSATQQAPEPHPHRHDVAHPANLPPATTAAYRYSFRDGRLIEL